MSELVAIGPRDLISCFAALGAELRCAANAEEMAKQLERASREKDISLVLLPEDCAEGCMEAVNRFREESDAVLMLLPVRTDGLDISAEEIGKEIEKAVGVNLLKTGSRSKVRG